MPEPHQLLTGLKGLREFDSEMQEEFAKVDKKKSTSTGTPFNTTMGLILILMMELESQKIEKCRNCGCG